jgi:hypothetical protein
MTKKKPVTQPFEEWLADHDEWRQCPDLIVSPPTVEEIETDFPEVDASEFFTDSGQPFLMKNSEWITAIAHYARMRQNGQKHVFAAMCAQERGPALMTDATFFEGNKRLGDNFDAGYLNTILTSAKHNHNFTPGPYDQYHPGLARFRGDPEAFVPPTGGRGYIKKLCETRGWAVEGAVNLEAREPEADPFDTAPALAPDLIARNAANFAATKPDEASKMTRTQLRNHMIENHGVEN